MPNFTDQEHPRSIPQAAGFQMSLAGFLPHMLTMQGGGEEGVCDGSSPGSRALPQGWVGTLHT